MSDKLTSDRLALRLLGTPEALRDGVPVVFATRKALALLAFLGLEPGPHRRDKLSDLFFPDSDAEHGRAALRRTLALARQALQDDDALLGDRETLQMNPAAGFSVDASALVDALRDASDASRQAAFDAYRGEFMAGFSLPDAPDFDDWTGVQREYWRRQFERVADALSQSQLAQGAVMRAVDTASRWAALSPLDEAAHRRLLSALHAANRRGQALAVHETFKHALQRELGIEPDSETIALVERIRFGDQTRAGAVRRRSAQETSWPGGAAPLSLDIPFVGRVDALAQLAHAHERATKGEPSLVVIEGDAGIGKTRLATEFLALAQVRGATTLLGRAFETSGRLPYQSVADGLRTIANAPQLAALPEYWRLQLRQLVPELDAGGVARAASVDPAHLSEAIVRLTVAMASGPDSPAAGQPLVWCIDDVQWADDASLDVMLLALARWRSMGTRALLIATVRGGERSPNIERWLSHAAHEGTLRLIALSELTRDDSLTLVNQIVPDTASRMLLNDRLFERTRGHAFFLVETLKAIIERGGGGGDAAFDMPDSARELVRMRLRRLSPVARMAVAAGAVLGGDFSFETLHGVAGLNEDEALYALDDLLHARLLYESADAYSFIHDFVREVAYDEASQARRRVFHRRAFEVLRGARSAPNATLAHHALAARLSEHGFRYSLAAGDDAQRVFAVKQAIRHYDMAREMMHAVGAMPVEIERLHLRLGRAHELNGDFGQAAAEYEALLAFARMTAAPVAQCNALNRLATLAAQSFDAERAMRLLNEAAHIAEQSNNPASLCETEWNLAQTGYYALAPQIALPHAQRAVTLARAMDDGDVLARSLNALAWSSGDFAGDWPRTMACADEARSLFAAQGNRALEADCLCCLANARLNLGDAQGGLQAAREADSIAREIENLWGQAHSAVQQAKCLLDTGPLELALETAQRAIQLAQRANAPFLIVLSMLLAGDILRAMGAHGDARAMHAQVRDLLAQSPSPTTLELMSLAQLCLAADDADAGVKPHLPAALLDADRADIGINPPHSMLIGLYPMVRAFVALDARPAAEELTRYFMRFAGENPRYRVPLLCALSALCDDPATARAKLNEAEGIAFRLQLAADLSRIRKLRAADSDTARAAPTDPSN